MRRGDFSSIGTVRDPLTGDPFPGNVIPANRIVPSVQRYMERFFPLPTIGVSQPASNFNQAIPGGRSDRAWTLRIDQKLSNANTFFVRFTRIMFDFKSPDNGFPLEILGQQFFRRTAYPVVLSDTHSFSASVFNEFRVGFLRHNDTGHGPLKGADVINLVGLTGYPQPPDPDEYGLPGVAVSGLVSVAQTDTSRNIQNNWDVVDHLSWHRRNHSFKTGINLQLPGESAFPLSPSRQFGSSTFDGFATGQPFGDFLLGIPRTASRAADVGPYYGSANEWAVFFLDDWKMTSRLTLNLGLRYERHIPWVEDNDRLHTFDSETGSIVVPVQETISKINPLFPKEIPVITAGQAGFPDRSMIRTDSNDIAPRFGFAWRSGFHDLVVRGGYGIFYNFESRKGFRNITVKPLIATETFDNVLTAGVPLWSWPQAFPTGPARPLATQNISATAVDRDSSYSQQWNLTLEKEIAGYGVRLSYIGTVSKQLPFVRNLNQPFPGSVTFSQNLRPFPVYRDISYVDRGANQDFHSMQVQVTRRLSRGFALNAHYTYEKNLTDSPDSSIFGNTIENAWDRAREWGNEEYGLRHRFISYFNWDAPI